MNQHDGTIRELIWQEICPWLVLVRGLQLALGFRVLTLGTIGLILTTAGWRVVGGFFEGGADPVIAEWIEDDSRWPWQIDPRKDLSREEQSRPQAETSFETLKLPPRESWAEIYVHSWLYLAKPFLRLVEQRSTAQNVFYTLLNGIWAVLVWSLLGGAISRIAALQLTRHERLGIRGALTQTIGRFSSYIAAPILPLALIVLFTLPLAAAGLFARFSLGAWLVGLAWGVVLVFGFAIAVLAIGFLIGWPFLWATISVERTDAFDALSRAYAYVFQRPLKLLFYLLVAAALGAFGGFVVQIFTTATIAFGDWGVSWGSGTEAVQRLRESPASELGREPRDTPMPQTQPDADTATDAVHRSASRLRRYWLHFARSIGVGFAAGFVWVSGVGMYLLLRRDIDATEMDEITLEDQDHLYGLPSLEQHPSGVPEVTSQTQGDA